jgi:hypothetical protein
MRLDLKIKTLLKSLRLTLQLVVAVVATEVDAMVGMEASQISIMAMSIMAMSSEDMSNTKIISVEVTIHVEEVMVALVKAIANSSSSMEVTNLPIRFVPRLVTQPLIAGRGFRKIIVVWKDLLVQHLGIMGIMELIQIGTLILVQLIISQEN